MGPPCTESELPDPMCPVTEWSDWSPCSASCGKGVKLRTRFLLVNAELQQKCGSRVETVQQRPCMDVEDCSLTREDAKEVCMMENEPGPCNSRFDRWYFDSTSGQCSRFVYGGCKGNRNNFMSREECLNQCGFISNTQEVPRSRHNSTPLENSVYRVDCVVSPWSEWSPCSVTCGKGTSERFRMIKVEARNGGRPCPAKLTKIRRCIRPAC